MNTKRLDRRAEIEAIGCDSDVTALLELAISHLASAGRAARLGAVSLTHAFGNFEPMPAIHTDTGAVLVFGSAGLLGTLSAGGGLIPNEDLDAVLTDLGA